MDESESNKRGGDDTILLEETTSPPKKKTKKVGGGSHPTKVKESLISTSQDDTNDTTNNVTVDSIITPLVQDEKSASVSLTSKDDTILEPNANATTSSGLAVGNISTSNVAPHNNRQQHSVVPLSMQLLKPFWTFSYCTRCGPTPHTNTASMGFSSIWDHTNTNTNDNSRNNNNNSPRDSAPIFFHGQTVSYDNSSNQTNDTNFNSLYCMPINKIDQVHGETNNNNQEQDDTNIINHPSTTSNDNKQITTTTRIQPTQTTNPTPSPIQHQIPPSSPNHFIIQTILQEYVTATQFYGCKTINSGVLTTLRFSLPTLRVSGPFHDSDMLALCEILLLYINTHLKFIKRLDFSVASNHGKIIKLSQTKGFQSHGAFTLSKVLFMSQFVEEVYLSRNSIGPYGATAIFMAVRNNQSLKTLIMRRCLIKERGALAFAEYILGGDGVKCSSLKDVDLSVNRIGFKGCLAIEESLMKLNQEGESHAGKNRILDVDLEGNLVFQEIMNGITHGLGIVLCIVGACALSNRVKDLSFTHNFSCGVYSASLLVLYISSTLYHSFFALTFTRYIFGVLDQCAIYILIAGSYTPFLTIGLKGEFKATCLIYFIWLCCICGIFVEALYSTWQHKKPFSLAMYLGMGWSALVCIPDMKLVLPQQAIKLIILGGVAYTSGVPFFVRNNNLDHSIWHCFVLAGSVLHWLSVYLYVARMT